MPNIGIRDSAGEFLCFLGADDLFAQRRIEKTIEAILSHPEAFAYTDVYTFDDNQKVNRQSHSSHLPPDGRYAHAWLLIHEFTAHCSMMITRDHIKRIGLFDESLNWAEDMEYSLRLSREFEVTVVREPLYGCRKHEASSTSTRPERDRRKVDYEVLSKQLELSKGIIDDETKYKTVRRLLRYARISRDIAGYAKWATDPIFVMGAARKIMRR